MRAGHRWTIGSSHGSAYFVRDHAAGIAFRGRVGAESPHDTDFLRGGGPTEAAGLGALEGRPARDRLQIPLGRAPQTE